MVPEKFAFFRFAREFENFKRKKRNLQRNEKKNIFWRDHLMLIQKSEINFVMYSPIESSHLQNNKQNHSS